MRAPALRLNRLNRSGKCRHLDHRTRWPTCPLNGQYDRSLTVGGRKEAGETHRLWIPAFAGMTHAGGRESAKTMSRVGCIRGEDRSLRVGALKLLGVLFHPVCVDLFNELIPVYEQDMVTMGGTC